MESPVIIIFGPIASGKGTQAELLVDTLGLVYMSLGDILRKEASNDSMIAKTIKEYMDKGELVPFEIVDELVRQRLEDPDIEKGIIFDGYPRALPQAKTLVKMLERKGKKVTKVISLKLEMEEILNRLSTRLICPNCRSIYNTKSDPPKVPGICDKCGTALIKRSDDQEAAAIAERMEIYKNETQDVLKFFDKMGIVYEFDANKSIQALHQEILEKITPAFSIAG